MVARTRRVVHAGTCLLHQTDWGTIPKTRPTQGGQLGYVKELCPLPSEQKESRLVSPQDKEQDLGYLMVLVLKHLQKNSVEHLMSWTQGNSP